MSGQVHVVATLKRDAVAKVATTAAPVGATVFAVELDLEVPGVDAALKPKFEFNWPTQGGGNVQDLLAGLKKGKSVELIAELDKAKLVAKFVRIERIDFTLNSPPDLLV